MTKRSTHGLLVCLTAALFAVCASAARADNGSSLLSSVVGGNCGATTTPFAPWGDNGSYTLAPGGSFEPGSPAWTLTGGAKVVSGNEPFHVNSSSDTSSLLIPAGGTATSGEICFGVLNPGFRFFATSTGGPATVHVQLIARGVLGALTVLDGGTANVGTTWAPTPVFSTLVSQLNVLGGSKSVELKITTTGNVQIDDVYNDPFCSR